LKLLYFSCNKEIVIALLKLRTLHTLDVSCKNTLDTDLIPVIKQNRHLEALVIRGMIISSPIENLYQAANHIPFFGADYSIF
jgi:3-deoxy-D-arabino-heptulosonate 7-phosphate (DAHP) synthase